jgi:hypothetical protein
MASNAKRKTTMAKLNREAKVRDKKLRKQARKDQRKADAAAGITPEEQPELETFTVDRSAEQHSGA